MAQDSRTPPAGATLKRIEKVQETAGKRAKTATAEQPPGGQQREGLNKLTTPNAGTRPGGFYY